ncbi:MAG: NAD(P)/FAD-dependent oxidoreductase [Emcibacteraceae bacterium]|nr:NAD(P)/FAD-dependent oxidoreductase [Emcibacteraceae bacterium]
MTEETIKTDMIIVGAGPVGLFAVFEAGLLGLKCQLIDNLDRPGGQCTELYPEKPIYDIPSRPKVTGQELVDDLMKQISPFDAQFHLGQQAESLEQLRCGNWRLETTRGVVLEAPIVTVAAGAGSFVPKKPPYKDIDLYEESSIDYAVHKMEKYRDKKLIIVGGGDSALDWVMSLEPIAKKITLVHRREGFRAAPDSVAQVKALVASGKVDFVIGNVKGLNGDDGVLNTITIDPVEGERLEVPCDYLMPFMGLKISLGPIAHWGLNLNKKHILVDHETFATDVDGIYAIGDVCSYPGKIKLILTGFYEGAVMCHAAFQYAFPDRKMATGYTTTNSAIQERLGVS